MWLLSRFMMRRDRIQIPLWLVGLTLLCVLVATAFGEMFSTQADMMGMVAALENPAMIAMLGPLYDQTLGALYAQNMMVFTAMGVVVMNIFLVARHTRADEEEGRLEVLRSLPIGRLTILKAALFNALLVNLVLGLAIGLGLAFSGMETGTIGEGLADMNGALLFGAAMGATGLVFAAATAVFAQLSANNRSVLSYGFIFLGVAYLLRAMGDLNMEALSLISPLGLIFRTEAFVGNYWWPIGILVAVAAILAAVALHLNGLRDLGAGFIAAKPGKSHGGVLLQTPFLLSLKLSKGTLLGWTLTTFILGASYGSVFGDIENFIAGNEMFQQIFAGSEGESLILQFISFIIIIMALIAAIPILGVVLKAKAEEKKNRLEHLLARPVSRFNILGGYALIAAVATPWMLFVTALGLYAASAPVLDEPLPFGSLLASVLAYAPALWVLLGLGIFLIGNVPRLASWSWAYLAYSFFAIYLGGILDLPAWMGNITPFGHVGDDVGLWVNILLIAVSLGLAGLGFLGYGKQDISG